MKHIIFVLTSLLMILSLSCQQSTENISEPGSVNQMGKVSISISQAPDEITNVIATLSRPNFEDKNLILSISDSERSASGEFTDIHVGMWHLKVDAKDNHGIIRYSGETGVEVLPAQVAVVDLELLPATGSIEIHVTWGRRCTPPPSGLVSWWTGDGTANDLVGTNHGILMNGTTFADGKVGKAFSLDGINDYVRIPNAPILNPTGGFTVDAWIYPMRDGHATVFGSWGAYYDWYNQRAWNLALRPGRKVEFSISDSIHQLDTSYHIFRTSEDAITLNRWNYIVGVYNMATGRRQIYVNGIKLAERVDPSTVVTKSNADIAIGTELDSPYHTYRFFQGFIDEVDFYNKALTGEEIRAIYYAGSSGKCK